jgi:hypothetical protein
MRKSYVLGALAAGVAAGAAGKAQAAPLFPLPQQIGEDTGANYVITLLPGNKSTIVQDSSVAPYYDGSDDVIVGIINNSGGTVSNIALSGSDIFGFEGDGLNNTTVGNDYTGGNPADTSGYAGPDNTYTVKDVNDGTVNFTPNPLKNGDSTFFGLEAPPAGATGGGITVGPVTGGGGTTAVPLSAAAWQGLALMGLLGLGKLVSGRKAVRA